MSEKTDVEIAAWLTVNKRAEHPTYTAEEVAAFAPDVRAWMESKMIEALRSTDPGQP